MYQILQNCNIWFICWILNYIFNRIYKQSTKMMSEVDGRIHLKYLIITYNVWNIKITGI